MKVLVLIGLSIAAVIVAADDHTTGTPQVNLNTVATVTGNAMRAKRQVLAETPRSILHDVSNSSAGQHGPTVLSDVHQTNTTENIEVQKPAAVVVTEAHQSRQKRNQNDTITTNIITTAHDSSQTDNSTEIREARDKRDVDTLGPQTETVDTSNATSPSTVLVQHKPLITKPEDLELVQIGSGSIQNGSVVQLTPEVINASMAGIPVSDLTPREKRETNDTTTITVTTAHNSSQTDNSTEIREARDKRHAQADNDGSQSVAVVDQTPTTTLEDSQASTVASNPDTVLVQHSALITKPEDLEVVQVGGVQNGSVVPHLTAEVINASMTGNSLPPNLNRVARDVITTELPANLHGQSKGQPIEHHTILGGHELVVGQHTESPLARAVRSGDTTTQGTLPPVTLAGVLRAARSAANESATLQKLGHQGEHHDQTATSVRAKRDVSTTATTTDPHHGHVGAHDDHDHANHNHTASLTRSHSKRHMGEHHNHTHHDERDNHYHNHTHHGGHHNHTEKHGKHHDHTAIRSKRDVSTPATTVDPHHGHVGAHDDHDHASHDHTATSVRAKRDVTTVATTEDPHHGHVGAHDDHDHASHNHTATSVRAKRDVTTAATTEDPHHGHVGAHDDHDHASHNHTATSVRAKRDVTTAATTEDPHHGHVGAHDDHDHASHNHTATSVRAKRDVTTAATTEDPHHGHVGAHDDHDHASHNHTATSIRTKRDASSTTLRPLNMTIDATAATIPSRSKREHTPTPINAPHETVTSSHTEQPLPIVA